MNRVDARLLEKLRTRLNVTDRQIRNLISAVVHERHLTRQQAAIALAHDRGITVSGLASEGDLAAIRGAPAASTPVRSVTVPAAEPRPAGSPSKHAAKHGRVRPKRGASDTERRRGTSVFVVHGRNEYARRELFSFLRAVGLEPLEWNQAIALTRKGTPYVGEILDAAFRQAVAIVVLFTPDDEARLKEEFLNSRDGPDERNLTGQARPNVLFEAGMAFGRDPNATVLVQIGKLRSFSDIAGRHMIHLSNTPDSRNDLIVRLANAGANVTVQGKTDWLNEGDFSLGNSSGAGGPGVKRRRRRAR